MKDKDNALKAKFAKSEHECSGTNTKPKQTRIRETNRIRVPENWTTELDQQYFGSGMLKSCEMVDILDAIDCIMLELSATLDVAKQALQYPEIISQIEPLVFPTIWPRIKLEILRRLSSSAPPAFRTRLLSELTDCEQVMDAVSEILVRCGVNPQSVWRRELIDAADSLMRLVTQLEEAYLIGIGISLRQFKRKRGLVPPYPGIQSQFELN